MKDDFKLFVTAFETCLFYYLLNATFHFSVIDLEKVAIVLYNTRFTIEQVLIEMVSRECFHN